MAAIFPPLTDQSAGKPSLPLINARIQSKKFKLRALIIIPYICCRYGSAAATCLLRIKRESGVNPELSRSCKKFNERETVLSAIPLSAVGGWEGSRAGLRARRPAITYCMRGFRGKGQKQIPQAFALHDFRFSFSRTFQFIVIFSTRRFLHDNALHI